MNATLVVDAHCTIGESPVWLPERGAVAWVDLHEPWLHVWDLSDGRHAAVPVERPWMFIGLAVDGDVVFATSDAVSVGPLTGPWRVVARLDTPDVRFNDGAVDPAGRLWIGATSLVGDTSAGVVYRMDRDALTPILAGLGTPNGIGWSPDARTMYVTDSHVGRIDAFDFDVETGRAGPGRPFAAFDPAIERPDGLAVDRLGNLWSAMWGGGRVVRFDPDGRVDAEVRVPTPLVTSCAFGGPDLDRLFITTASGPLGRASPGAGALYELRSGVRGTAASRAGSCVVPRNGEGHRAPGSRW